MYIYIIIFVIFIYFFLIPKPNIKAIKILIKSSAQLATESRQDGSPLLSTIHSAYAVGYLNALKEISNPKEIHRSTGIDFEKFEKHIINSQEYSKNKLLEKCPQLKEEADLYLSEIIEKL